ncbi:hypothetical protein EXIGLDRAFT_745216 [Exidia glandulosa HHB12029]|uniref:Uncharacterized protein n=1 Tax=Exidia glandulosa HHB12029 TaxID=1314781 RepID=A0A166BHW4_EXIGL|nr:hypothetical protein EXIGLDRAFT_745216 [Exidia glandulosa HHB12029]
MVAIKSLLALALAIAPAFSQYISGIQTIYGTKPHQEPTGTVSEITGQSNDMNFQFGGDFVWLRPIGTADSEAAATGFDLTISNKEIPWAADLAAGAGGDYRYLFPSYGGKSRIIDIALYRPASATSSPPTGYDAMSGDINQGRSKTYLYLVWKFEKGVKAEGSNVATEGPQKYVSDTVKEL